MKESYNIMGIQLSDEEMFVPLNLDFFDEIGNPRWSKYIRHGDLNGFDMDYIFPNGTHIRKVILPPGKRLIRFGHDVGSFTTDYC